MTIYNDFISQAKHLLLGKGLFVVSENLCLGKCFKRELVIQNWLNIR